MKNTFNNISYYDQNNYDMWFDCHEFLSDLEKKECYFCAGDHEGSWCLGDINAY